MNQIQVYFLDDRLSGVCVYCGTHKETRDHVPAKVFLDDPLPDNLPVVEACDAWNQSFAKDEQYLACLIDVARLGTTIPSPHMRLKVQRILQEQPLLAARIQAQGVLQSSGWSWAPELFRVDNVILKLARGHAAYENGEPNLLEPKSIAAVPLLSMSDRQRSTFELMPIPQLWPEVGSRAMLRVLESEPDFDGGWIEVQPERYRFMTIFNGGITVRVVLSEYLACEVRWD